MDKILEALTKLLPQDSVAEVTEAVKEELAKAKSALEAEYNKNLEAAYATLSDELKEAEQTGVQGYKEAFAIIEDLRNRLQMQQAEFKTSMNKGYEEAFQMLEAEKAKNAEIEQEMFDKFSAKLQEMREYMIDKVHQFLEYKGGEIYEQARRDILNDPRMAEHKVALDKVVECVSSYIDNDDFVAVSNSKLEDANQKVKDLQSQMKILEARNIRLDLENNKLNESIKSREVISEATEKKERARKAQNAEGRGRVVNKSELIAEWQNTDVKTTEPKSEVVDKRLVESLGAEYLHVARVLAGTPKKG